MPGQTPIKNINVGTLPQNPNRFDCEAQLLLHLKRLLYTTKYTLIANTCWQVSMNQMPLSIIIFNNSFTAKTFSNRLVLIAIFKLFRIHRINVCNGMVSNGGYRLVSTYEGGGYFRVNFGHLKSEVFHLGGGGYFGVNFGHLKSEVFHWGGGYFRVNFGHLKSEVFHWGGVFRSKLWSSQI